MYTRTCRSDGSIKVKTALGAAALAVLFTFSSAAWADSPAPPAADTLAARISLAGLDLATPDGAREALRRLRTAAQRLCWQLGDDLKAANRATMNACVRETVADAVRKINAPTVAALAR